MILLNHYYLWFKAMHVISVISWMSGIFYLPRIYVYHVKVQKDSELDRTFKIMEGRLLKIIMNPAIMMTYIFGFINAYVYGISNLGLWFHIKMLAVLGLTIFHFFLIKCYKSFVIGNNIYSVRFYKMINEIPTILMIIAVIMVIIKPF